MTFSKKAEAPTTQESSITSSQWAEWSNMQWEAFNAKAVDKPKGGQRKEKALIGVVNYIQDMGYPPAKDSEWPTKCALPAEGEEYSAEELDWKQKNPSHDFIWTKQYNAKTKVNETVRKQTSPSYPMQEYGICVDFPQIMIDYGKHPARSEDPYVEDVRPLRISLNGSKKFFSPITFGGNGRPIKDNNLVYKICAAAGREQQLVDSSFDIGTAAGAICNFKVVADRKEDGDDVSVYFKASVPSVISDIEIPDYPVFTAEAQIEKVLAVKGIPEFLGVLLEHSPSDEVLEYVNYDSFGFIARAELSKSFTISGTSAKGDYSFEKGVDYETTPFAKALAKYRSENGVAPSQEKPEVDEKPVQPKPSESVTQSYTPAKQDLDFDDDQQ